MQRVRPATCPLGTSRRALDVAGVQRRLEAGNGGYEIVHVSPGLEVGVSCQTSVPPVNRLTLSVGPEFWHPTRVGVNDGRRRTATNVDICSAFSRDSTSSPHGCVDRHARVWATSGPRNVTSPHRANPLAPSALTTSLPWKFRSVTRVHPRSFAAQFVLQIRCDLSMKQDVARRRACPI